MPAGRRSSRRARTAAARSGSGSARSRRSRARSTGALRTIAAAYDAKSARASSVSGVVARPGVHDRHVDAHAVRLRGVADVLEDPQLVLARAREPWRPEARHPHRTEAGEAEEGHPRLGIDDVEARTSSSTAPTTSPGPASARLGASERGSGRRGRPGAEDARGYASPRMRENLEGKLQALPRGSGVYLFRDERARCSTSARRSRCDRASAATSSGGRRASGRPSSPSASPTSR